MSSRKKELRGHRVTLDLKGDNKIIIERDGVIVEVTRDDKIDGLLRLFPNMKNLIRAACSAHGELEKRSRMRDGVDY